MGFWISRIVFEKLAFKLKKYPKIAIFGDFLKNKFLIADCEQTKKDIEKPMLGVVEYHPKSVLSNFEPKRVKGLRGDSFFPEAFFETPKQATETLWHFSKIFFDFFLNFIKGFQNIYGYGGLKLQTKKKG